MFDAFGRLTLPAIIGTRAFTSALSLDTFNALLHNSPNSTVRKLPKPMMQFLRMFTLP